MLLQKCKEHSTAHAMRGCCLRTRNNHRSKFNNKKRISMTIRIKRRRQIIFPSCTVSNISSKIPNYLYSRLESKIANPILSLTIKDQFGVTITDFCINSSLDPINSSSLGILPPNSNFPITSVVWLCFSCAFFLFLFFPLPPPKIQQLPVIQRPALCST